LHPKFITSGGEDAADTLLFAAILIGLAYLYAG